MTKSQRLTSAGGTVTSVIDLDPWGGETSKSANQAFQPRRFTSYNRDADGRDEAMWRRYGGDWMRFHQPDPYRGSYDLADPQSLNRYSYTRNDPVNFTDPSGLDFCWGETLITDALDHGPFSELAAWRCSATRSVGSGGGGGGGQRGGGGGGGRPPEPEKATFDETKLKDCLERLFGVTPLRRNELNGGEEINSLGLITARTGGSFFGRDLSAGRNYYIETNTTAFTSRQIAELRSMYNSGTAPSAGERAEAVLFPINPNYNLVASDLARTASFEALRSAQIHETGNSLAELTGRNRNRANPAFGDSDNGAALEECVYGGYVNRDGTLRRTGHRGESMRLNKLIWFALTVALLPACSQWMQGDPASHLGSKQTLESVVVSTIVERERNTWKVSPLKLNGGMSLTAIQFSSITEGWVADNKDSLYKTSDGGKSWHQMKIEIRPNTHIASIFFINSSVGWITLSTNSSGVGYGNNDAWLMHTGDGGQSWREQYNAKALEVHRLRFVNDQEGWAVGRRRVMRETLQDELFILHTTDQGQHWVDVSERLNIIRDFVIDIYAAEPAKATLLTRGGQLLSTVNGGKSWEQVATIQAEPEQIGMLRVGMSKSKRLWVLGGADSREGVWTTLTQRDNDKSWMKYKLNNVYLKDAVFFSDNQVLACGSIPTDKNTMPNGGERIGVVIHSIDNGRSWDIIYRNRQTKSINALTIMDSDDIWAVGEDGLILRLQPFSDGISGSHK